MIICCQISICTYKYDAKVENRILEEDGNSNGNDNEDGDDDDNEEEDSDEDLEGGEDGGDGEGALLGKLWSHSSNSW